MKRPAALGYTDIQSVLARLASLPPSELVLVGGQAVNFWADLYGRRGLLGDLARGEPFASKDIDFCGAPGVVEQCAKLLNGTYRLAGFDDPGPNSGVVAFLDERGVERSIDVLRELYGVDSKSVRRTALPIEVLTEQGQRTGVYFYVLHPVLCLFSRAANTAGLPGYATPHALRQLKASVLCCAHFLSDLCGQGEQRAVLNLNEMILSFAGRRGLPLYRAHGIDIFEGAFTGHGLPQRFYDLRLPRMRAWLEGRRASEDRRFERAQRLRERSHRAAHGPDR